jgi:hypothetical protein
MSDFRLAVGVFVVVCSDLRANDPVPNGSLVSGEAVLLPGVSGLPELLPGVLPGAGVEVGSRAGRGIGTGVPMRLLSPRPSLLTRGLVVLPGVVGLVLGGMVVSLAFWALSWLVGGVSQHCGAAPDVIARASVSVPKPSAKVMRTSRAKMFHVERGLVGRAGVLGWPVSPAEE